MSFGESGWVWEGLGFDPGVEPSIYGVGEGAAYFGLERSQLYFHPNDEVTLGKLADKQEVVCDISKWKWVEIPPDSTGGTGFRNWRDSAPATVIHEAAKLSALSVEFPNITGGIIDDASGVLHHETYTEDHAAEIGAALRSANPDLGAALEAISKPSQPVGQALLPAQVAQTGASAPPITKPEWSLEIASSL